MTDDTQATSTTSNSQTQSDNTTQNTPTSTVPQTTVPQTTVSQDIINTQINNTGTIIGTTYIQPNLTTLQGAWSYCQTQIIQIITSIVLLALNSYLQSMTSGFLSSIERICSNLQQTYMSNPGALYTQSNLCGTGIIAVNNESFLINIGLPEKMIVNSQTNLNSVSLTDAQNLLSQYLKSLPQPETSATRLCMITILGSSVSISLPNYSQIISIPAGNAFFQSGDFSVSSQQGYISLTNQKTQQTYVLKNDNGSITWMFYKDAINNVSLEMTGAMIAIGNKNFLIQSEAGDAAYVINPRTKRQVDPFGISY